MKKFQFLSIFLVLLALAVVAEARMTIITDPNLGGIQQQNVVRFYAGGPAPVASTTRQTNAQVLPPKPVDLPPPPQQYINPNSAVMDKPVSIDTVNLVSNPNYEKSLPTVRPPGAPTDKTLSREMASPTAATATSSAKRFLGIFKLEQQAVRMAKPWWSWLVF